MSDDGDGDITGLPEDQEGCCYVCGVVHPDGIECPYERSAAPKPKAGRPFPGGTGLGVVDKEARKRYMRHWRKVDKMRKGLRAQGVPEDEIQRRIDEQFGDASAH